MFIYQLLTLTTDLQEQARCHQQLDALSSAWEGAEGRPALLSAELLQALLCYTAASLFSHSDPQSCLKYLLKIFSLSLFFSTI